MNHRFAALIAMLLLATLPMAGQTPSAGKAAPAAKKWVAPRTPDGQPDIQGFWTNSTYVPLERPANVNKEFYTPEEAAQAEKRAAEREAEQTEPGTVADVHYDFTQFGLDRSQNTYASSLRTSLITSPANGRVPPLNAEGQKRQAERAAARRAMGGQYDQVQNMAIGSRCLVMGGSGPPMLNAGYNSNYHIVQSPGYVMILTEMIHDVRIIPVDGRPHISPNIRQWFGDSRGRWEGETLVVETTNFSDKNPFRGASPKMKVIERFTRTAPDLIRYEFTIDDETTWSTPWSAEMPMKLTKGPIFEFACHETNYGVTNTLAGVRGEEKRLAEEAAKKGK